MPDAPNPGRIFDVLNAHQQSAALRGAIELEVFSSIAQGQRTAAALAKRCSADARAMRILCDYLVVHEFLTKNGDEYGLAPISAAFLVKESPAYMGGIARFVNSPDLLDAFQDVAELVRRGSTLLDRHGTTTEAYEGWVEFARCMVPLIMPAAQQIGALAARLKSGPVSVLDIAAGHGMFGISVAKANPQASIVALDWPNVLEVAKENAAAAGVSDRYSLLPGDAMKVPFGAGFDIVLMTNFLHHFDRPTCDALMRKTHACLQDDGLVITLEFVPNEDRVSPPTAATFALMMLGTTPSGDAYTFSEYDAMWGAAGFASSELIDLPDSPQRLIVTRRKPG
jgi:predicted O-methyltransferase YrrM